MLYRVLSNITFQNGERLVKGSKSQLLGRSPKTIELLLRRGGISEVQIPPLRVLPGWEERAKLLESVGIVTIAQLLEADLSNVSVKLNVPLVVLERAVDSARRWIDRSSN